MTQIFHKRFHSYIYCSDITIKCRFFCFKGFILTNSIQFKTNKLSVHDYIFAGRQKPGADTSVHKVETTHYKQIPYAVKHKNAHMQA